MPNGNFKSLTLNKLVTEKYDLDSEKLHEYLTKIIQNKEELQRFASKIEITPEIVRNYTNFPKGSNNE